LAAKRWIAVVLAGLVAIGITVAVAGVRSFGSSQAGSGQAPGGSSATSARKRTPHDSRGASARPGQHARGANAGLAAGSPRPLPQTITTAHGTPPRAAAVGQIAEGSPVTTFSSWLDQAQVNATSTAEWGQIARQNAVVVLNSWDYWLIPVLKRANPHVKVWVYKDLSGVRSDDCNTASGQCGACAPGVLDSPYLSSGMGYCWILRNHPDWILRKASNGKPLRFRGYAAIWETEYGNPGYLRVWVKNVLADVRKHGWDGVDVDNALTTATAYGVSVQYSTNAAVQHATYTAMRYITANLRPAGVKSVFNVGFAPMFPGLWNQWLQSVDGLEQQFYLSYSDRPTAIGTGWQAYQQEVSSCAAMHKTCWFHTGGYYQSVTPQTRDYALASYLLAADGQQLLSVGTTVPLSSQSCLRLGAPTGLVQITGQAWVRMFSRGVAVVNPSDTAVSVSLGGTYVDAAGRRLSAITLGPSSGAVLGLPGTSRC
jgi:hypothetical protein